MKYRSVFDIIGPVMVGPSSSHTAGAARLGLLAGRIFGKEPDRIRIHFFGSFAETYRGHATDVAVIGGILSFDTDDPRIPDSLEIAAEKGIEVSFFCEEAIPVHPNTVRMVLSRGEDTLEVTGISIGGGSVQITQLDGFALKLSGDHPAILILHKDIYGTVAAVANILAGFQINIGSMEVSRMEKGQNALMVIETDQRIPGGVIQRIEERENMIKVIVLER